MPTTAAAERTTATTTKGPWRLRSRALLFVWFIIVLLCLFASVDAARFTAFSSFDIPKEDPYEILGIPRKDRSSMDAIKKAYRQKAKDSHPDKNLDMDPQKANAKFHRINEAWEFLSDAQKKRQYDQRRSSNGGRHPPASQPTRQPSYQRQQAQNLFRKQQEQQRRAREEEERQRKAAQETRAKLVRDAQIAQERIVKLSTIEQLQGMTDLFDKGTLTFRKHFLCVFVSDKKVEKMADHEYLFPYPFGSSTTSFDWTEILVAAKVRYNTPTPLTRAFRAPAKKTKPYIVFATKGSRLDKGEFETYQPHRLMQHSIERFEQWVLDRLKATVTVVNRFADGGPTLRVFIDTGDKTAKVLSSAGRSIPPGFMLETPMSVSHRLIVVDANLDNFIGSTGIETQRMLRNDPDTIERVAMDIFTVKHQKQRFELKETNTRHCYDLSTTCHEWAKGGGKHCSSQTDFSHAMCSKSCGVCLESHYWNGLYYTFHHLPIYKVPNVPGARPVLSLVRNLTRFGHRFLDVAWQDFPHLLEVRRNVTAGFLISGILFGIQIVLLARMILGGPGGKANWISNNGDASKNTSLVLILLPPSIQLGLKLWLSRSSNLPKFLLNFWLDLQFVETYAQDFLLGLYGLGILSCLLSAGAYRGRHNGQSMARHAASFVVFVVSSAFLLLATDFFVIPESGMTRSRWDSVWELRKNVAVAIICWGCITGVYLLGVVRLVTRRLQQQISTRLVYFLLSIVNIGLWISLVSLAFVLDRSFERDLEHVLSMRMSAGIPCILVGAIMGLSGAHFVSTHHVKMKVE